MHNRKRLDACLALRGLTPSREKAQVLILAGLVRVNGQKITKPSAMIDEQDKIDVLGKEHPFVSRGGLKLDKAMRVFPIDVSGKVCVDIGASTGGFTDCLLQNGAARVFAIDVGYGQLDYALRNDARVEVRERCNARYMEPGWFDIPLDFACMDVSFISIKLILAPLLACLREAAQVLALIKPQFEAGRSQIGKKGVVRDAAVHEQVLMNMLSFARTIGYAVLGLDFSPITGAQGNVEFLLFLGKSKDSAWTSSGDGQKVKEVVTAAHARYHEA